MIELTKISQLLEADGISILGEIIRDTNNSNLFFVHVNVERNTENKQIPSNRSLDRIRALASKEGAIIEFLLVDACAQDLEVGLRATLMHALPNDIRNVFLSIEGANADVWYDPKRTLDEDTEENVKRRATLFLESSDLTLRSLTSTNLPGVPSKLALLRAIRHISPASAAEIKAELVRRKFDVPSDDWLNRRLDAMRKANTILRLTNGQYALPLTTIQALGTEKNGFRSPDVTRLLALARKPR